MEGQYASAYAGARQTYSQGRARLDAIQAVRPCFWHLLYLFACEDQINAAAFSRSQLPPGQQANPGHQAHKFFRTVSCKDPGAVPSVPGLPVCLMAVSKLTMFNFCDSNCWIPYSWVPILFVVRAVVVHGWEKGGGAVGVVCCLRTAVPIPGWGRRVSDTSICAMPLQYLGVREGGGSVRQPLQCCPNALVYMRMQARTRKLEAESKLAGLQKDLAELGSLSGDQAGQEEAQTMQLHQVCPATDIMLVKDYCVSTV